MGNELDEIRENFLGTRVQCVAAIQDHLAIVAEK